MKKENIHNLKKLEQQVAELTAGWQRTQADFINYKKQISQDRANLAKTTNSDLIYQMLPVLDNFKLAADHMPKDLTKNNWAEGVKQIERQLEIILENEGLSKIPALGEHFNPEIHEAIEEVASDKEEGTIITEILPGYIYNDQVLRPAKVKIAKKFNLSK